MAEQKKNTREAGMEIAIGGQGSGKTYQVMQKLYNLSKDKFDTKVRARKCLIFDTNGEYTESQFAENGIANFPVRKIAMKDLEAWSYSPLIQCRRIDAKSLSISEKLKCVEYIVKVCRNMVIVLDDINTYVLSMTHLEDIVSGFVNLRHRAVDIILSYQRLRAVEPIIYSNCRWVRLHAQEDDVYSVKNKIPNEELFKIAQIIVNNKFHGRKNYIKDPHMFLYVFVRESKIRGRFSLNEFRDACVKYVNGNPKILKSFMLENGMTDREEGIKAKVDELISLFFGNPTKTDVANPEQEDNKDKSSQKPDEKTV